MAETIKSSFSWLFPPAEDEFWKDCLFIFDTNTLLSLYRVRKETREELLSHLAKLKDRVWIPHQVAKEFLKHRAERIYTHNDLHRKLIDKLKTTVDAFVKDGDTPYLHDLKKIVDDNIEPVYKRLQEFGESYGCTVDKDVILESLNDIFADRVGPEYKPDEFAKKVKEAKKRITDKMPPGLQDATDKSKREVDGELDKQDSKNAKSNPELTDDPVIAERTNLYGDVMVWFQILDYCKSTPAKRVAFITNDTKKEEWYRRIAKRWIGGPREELQAELFANSQTHLRMYEFNRFLELCNSLLQTTISKVSISDVKTVQEQSKTLQTSLPLGTFSTSTRLRKIMKQYLSHMIDEKTRLDLRQLPSDQAKFAIYSRYLPVILSNNHVNRRYDTYLTALSIRHGEDQAKHLANLFIDRVISEFVSGI